MVSLIRFALAQVCLDPREQLHVLEGLHHIIIPAVIQRGDDALAVVKAAQKNDGTQAILFPDQRAERVSLSIRKEGIQQDELIGGLVQQGNSLRAGGSNVNGVACVCQKNLCDMSKITVILNK